MDVNKDLIKHVATMARLDLTESEVEEFIPQLKEIITHFEKIQEVDTDGVEPSFQPIKIRDAVREDVITPSLSQEDALKNSEQQKDGYFKGPSAL